MGQVAPIPFAASTAPGAVPQESSGRLINAYAEPLPKGSAAPFVIRRAPGLSALVDSGFTGFRGCFLVNNLLYAAFANHLVTVDASGAITNVGTLGGTGKVYFARNNLAPTPQVACVTENGAFLVTPTSISSWPDPDLPAPNSTCFQDGYFFFSIGDRRCFASNINTTSVDASSFVTAEAKSQDALIRVVPYNGVLFLCATASIEIWQDNANPFPQFPYNRVGVLQRGLAASSAIAGWEDGFGHALLWVADDDAVYQLVNMAPQKVSTPDLDRLIKGTADKSTLEAFVYVVAGHARWVLSSPTWTWELNLTTGFWNERVSGTLIGGSRWRATGNSQKAFGKWIIGDTQSGQLLAIDDTAYTEVAAAQLCRIESGLVSAFPAREQVGRADFNFVAGVGIATGLDPMQTDPSVMISWSDDNGITYKNPRIRKLGRQQHAKKRINVLNTGTAGPQGRRWRLDISDPVYVGLMGGTQGTTLEDF